MPHLTDTAASAARLPTAEWAAAFRAWARATFPTLPGLATLPDTVCAQLLTDPGVVAAWLDGRAVPPPAVRALAYPPETWRAVQAACDAGCAS